MKPADDSEAAYTPGGRLAVERDAAGWLIWHPPDCAQRPAAQWFSPAWWRSHGALQDTARGRGEAVFVQAAPDTTWVVRHYQRGGLLARINRDRYLWTGVARSRALREMAMLADLSAAGLAVPRPVAARIRRRGLTVSADLITVAIPNAAPLAEHLMHAALAPSVWHACGRAIAALHQAGVWHADLNARNILVDEDADVHLIDFDRARRRSPARRWRHDNLARLRRSLDKFVARETGFCFAESDWQRLQAGYREVFAEDLDAAGL
ncbi:3-deoxy-D-manno-octulosonic acid kinase [Salinisphaera sp. Q1T1-3]|uniref:3-deoxy-D-manno-octulosonic acid kinase n=1 Tax=Salinisphaera sp. Q1T1-3 TaxID=2321229 RepID=UPI000E7440BB|nr:3-deoxy-D-manno-octulosonic acid kinase [Salinisphaera sp. Q1T1-3]RJS94703.1 3-deoxy-D-manno-octulosonic acid kinase [Salinisphaera sp. Q1T1-3]